MSQTAAKLNNDLWLKSYGDMQDVGPAHRHMRRLLRRLLAELPYTSVLDVGCGAGHNLPILCSGRALERVVGVDVAREALVRAAARSDAHFELLDITQRVLAERFDLVFSSLLLEHLERDTDALSNMRAMCGKYLLLVTIAGNYARYQRWEEQVGHVRNYARGELEHKLRSAGFAVERAIYWGFPFYTPLARTLQNQMSPEPAHGAGLRVIGEAMNALYYLNLRRRGDLLLVLARPATSD